MSPFAQVVQSLMKKNAQTGGAPARHAVAWGVVYALLDLADAIRGLRP